MLERIAVGQHKATDSLAMVSDDELAERAAGVVAYERHVVELELLDQLGEHPRDAGGRDIRALDHRDPV
jgi:hypothetical protein